MPKLTPEERWKRVVIEKPEVFQVGEDSAVTCKICDVNIKLRNTLDSLSIMKHEKTEKHKRNFLQAQEAPSGDESQEDTDDTHEIQAHNSEAQPHTTSNASGEIRLALQHATKVVEDYELPWRRTVVFDISKQNLSNLIDLAYEKLYEDRKVSRVKAILLENTASIILEDEDLRVLQSGDVIVFHFVHSNE
ncbi:hypothetical protein K493DRAFT_297501 [Basidiobolus meristosporus CBS 931.73]|uniref:BED-type domain-containing protein n=1 Tax=Basidiobolus meristosporus CBS 931.73 TaxID=1314790 RepID=A0A1Y1YZB5_9FUNG|nr:hypothetical protein K493DRAFT_297501 [Basidiobolus meristosporus CBS 931.73]|eukprot:ORY03390.1 hypothetical protein K493DRAFT_297501 [Basidiobolus meristosporus CBS 931.73]